LPRRSRLSYFHKLINSPEVNHF